MESKSIFFPRFEENTNTEDVSNIIYLFPSASGADMRTSTAVPLLWLSAGRDVYGGEWRHAGVPRRWLRQQGQPAGHSERKVRHFALHPKFHNIMNFHRLYSMFWPSRCNFLYGTPTMFTDLVNQDIHKYDLSSVEAGKRSEPRNVMNMFWLWCDVWRCPRLCAAVSGLMGGAPCPPEILRKLKTDMNVKEISVSDYTSDTFSNNTVRLFQHIWTCARCVSTGSLWNHREQPCYIYWISARQRGAEAEYCRMYHEPHWGILSQKPGFIYNHDSTVTYSCESSL